VRLIGLRAGRISAVFDPAIGALRSVLIDSGDGEELEALRGIVMPVRDDDWDTVPPRLNELDITETARGFSVRFEARCDLRVGSFHWKGRIDGDRSGTLRFEMDGEVRTSFRRNRIGFCVLHPAECAGKDCEIESIDGNLLRGVFPVAIAPHQPFREIRAITHEVAPGLRVEVRLEGETFEMEDQRNWTDASFKTYSTPLALPYPVEVKTGERIRQCVSVTVHGLDSALSSTAAPRERSSVSLRRLSIRPETRRRMPRLGLGRATGGAALTAREIERIRALRLHHLRVDLHLGARDATAQLERGLAEALALGLRVELALFIPTAPPAPGAPAFECKAALIEVHEKIRRARAPLHALLLLPETNAELDERTLIAVRELFEGLPGDPLIVSGTDRYFAELNRARRPIAAVDGVSYSIHPQVHAFDDLSLVETLAVEGLTVENARRIAGGRPVLVSPVTLGRRPRASAAVAIDSVSGAELPKGVDPRQLSLFGAAWTVGSLRSLALAGAHSVTYYETVGWRGVLERSEGSRLPALFPSIPGEAFPIYHVLADAGEFADGDAVDCDSSHPLEVAGLVLEEGGRRRIVAVNFTAETRHIAIEGFARGRAFVRRLDAETVEAASRSPETFRGAVHEQVSSREGVLELALGPYATVRIDDSEGGHARV
jgi:hypothetical protein